MDSLPEAEKYILEALKNYVASPDQNIPLTITITRIEERGPPSLGVNVGDTIVARSALA